MCRVRFAPLYVPYERRLQTAAVVFMLSVFPLIVFCVSTACLHPVSRALFIAYCLWTVTLDRKTPWRGGRVMPCFRRLPVWGHVVRYFPTQMHVTEPLDPQKQYVLALHPHGVVSLGVITSLIMEALRPGEKLGGINYRVGTVSFNTAAPIWREVLMAMGFVNAARPSLDYCLEHGMSVALVPGGAIESLYARPGHADLVLEKRKGFIKLAMAHGAPLVPCWIFGENELWDQVSNPEGSLVRRAQETILRLTGFTLPLPLGRGIFNYSFGILPRRVPLNVVVGAPLPVPKIAAPSPLQVDEVHARYLTAIRALYESNLPKFYLSVINSGHSPSIAAGPRELGAGLVTGDKDAYAANTAHVSPHGMPPLRLVR